MEQLETWFIGRYGLIEWKPRNIFDIGCGEGSRTRLIASYGNNTIGIDASKKMIELARRFDYSGLSFKCLDVTTRPEINLAPDVIVSCRCLINLSSQKTVIEALQWFYDILPQGGRLILLEASKQGHDSLNNLRKRLGVSEIKTAWYNINLDEHEIEDWFKHRFNILHKSRFGLYYAITRGFVPAAMSPKQPKSGSHLNQIASDVQREQGIGALEEYGRHYCLVCERL